MAISTIPSAGITGGGFNFRNLIINGDMSIAQRGTQSTGQTDTDGYSTCDRFRVTNYVGTSTFDQETLTSGNAYDNGFKKAFKITVTSTEATPSAGDQLYLETRLEGQMLQQLKKGTSNAESLTLSFWVKSSKTGTNLQVNFRDIDNSRMISGTYDINSANTWEKKTITVAGDTTGALDNDNNGSFRIEWYLDSGSSSTGGTLQTSWAARNVADSNITNFDLGGATDNWAITGVQLEVGTSASDFEFLPYDVNLRRCQRYFQFMGGVASGFPMMQVYGISGSDMRTPLSFPTTMRASPTATVNGTWQTLNTANPTFDFLSPEGCCMRLDVSGGSGQTYAHPNSTDDYVTFDSEL